MNPVGKKMKDECIRWNMLKRGKNIHIFVQDDEASENNRFQKLPHQKKQNNRNRSKIAALPTASNLESAKIHAANYLSHGLGGSSNHLSTCGPRGCQYQGMARNWRNWRMGLNLPAQIRSELSWNIGAVKAFQNCFRPQIYLTPRFRLGGSL